MKFRTILPAVIGCLLLQQIGVHATASPVVIHDSIAKHEFEYRLQLAYNRLSNLNAVPAFTDEFILADVNIDPANPRRFYNFSGDLSGRYIEVMSLSDKSKLNGSLVKLVSKLLTYQKTDGRFGSSALQFEEDKISGEHMALLWGNGRLLVGLMQYYKEYKDPKALEAARRLGDFFISSYKVCSTPAVSKRLEGLMAMGIICFTQYIEGLVMLSDYSGDAKYAQIAAETYKVLPPRGKQHSHGYLSTLRGVLMLYNYDHNKAHLNFVLSQYEDLVHSDDYTCFGSVREYFGSADVDRDEGCSTADFLRLSLDLYAVTGNKDYLNKGENALLNALYFNQYYTGDFGHHVLNFEGSSPDLMHASWWCCTMHGLRAMYEVQRKYMVEETTKSNRINLFLETSFKGNDFGCTIQNDGRADSLFYYTLSIDYNNNARKTLALRMPPWAKRMMLSLNGKQQSLSEKDGYLIIEKIQKNDIVRVAFQFKVSIQTEDGQVISETDLTQQPIAGYLHYGPFLLGGDDKNDDVFTAEPNENIVYLNKKTTLPASGFYYPVIYQHGGYPSILNSTLRPVSSLTFDRHGYLMARLMFAADGGGETKARSQSMQAPFNPSAPSKPQKQIKRTY